VRSFIFCTHHKYHSPDKILENGVAGSWVWREVYKLMVGKSMEKIQIGSLRHR
jgi:hypothetical protein